MKLILNVKVDASYPGKFICSQGHTDHEECFKVFFEELLESTHTTTVKILEVKTETFINEDVIDTAATKVSEPLLLE